MAAAGVIVGVATEDIDGPLVILRADVVLLAAELATLLPLGRPTGTTKAPADDAPQHKAPIIATADFILNDVCLRRGKGRKNSRRRARATRTELLYNCCWAGELGPWLRLCAALVD